MTEQPDKPKVATGGFIPPGDGQPYIRPGCHTAGYCPVHDGPIITAEQTRHDPRVKAALEKLRAQVEAEKREQETCPHHGLEDVEATRLGDAERRYLRSCRGCGLQWEEFECGRCGKRNPEPKSCECRKGTETASV